MKKIYPLPIIGLMFFVLAQGAITSAHQISNLEAQQQHGNSNEFDFSALHVGDTVAGMKVVSIQPAIESLPLSKDNFQVQFQGKAIISGKYHYQDTAAFGPYLWVDQLTPGSEEKLPKLRGEGSTSFCFSNMDDAQQIFGPVGSEGKTKVQISDYTYVHASAEVCNTAKLVSVLSKN